VETSSRSRHSPGDRSGRTTLAFRTIGAAAVGLALLALPHGVVASVVGRDAGAASARLAFTFPSDGQTSWSAGEPVDVRWTAPGGSTSQLLTEFTAPPDVNGSCVDAGWVLLAVQSPRASSAFMAVPDPERCYQWTIAVVTPAAVRQTTSGSLRTYGAWTGTLDLFRASAFSTQTSFHLCTSAATQMIINTVLGRSDHSEAGQQRIAAYEQANDRYPVGVAKGSDPQGWTAALREFGAGDYAWSAFGSLEDAIHTTAKRMRLTGKPAGLATDNGNHAWVMSGFDATADPAFTDEFDVTAVYIEGPLFPTQVLRRGFFDPEPDHRFTITQLAGAFTPYRDDLGPTWSIWEGNWVTIEP
jgi:hypothetical protein